MLTKTANIKDKFYRVLTKKVKTGKVKSGKLKSGTTVAVAAAYPEPFQTSIAKLFGKMVNAFKPLSISDKSSILNV